MTSLSDRIPQPPTTWTHDHDPSLLEGVVTARRDVHSVKYEKDFVVLEVVEDSGRGHEIPCGRADLAAFVRSCDPQEGDRIAIQYWGQQGPKHVYTGVSERGNGQQRLTAIEQSPELTDDDYVPDK